MTLWLVLRNLEGEKTDEGASSNRPHLREKDERKRSMTCWRRREDGETHHIDIGRVERDLDRTREENEDGLKNRSSALSALYQAWLGFVETVDPRLVQEDRRGMRETVEEAETRLGDDVERPGAGNEGRELVLARDRGAEGLDGGVESLEGVAEKGIE